eukprot:GGOE01041679.1.p1 GENE.GGOE01041679.1~~GGOE01041679.1.p1  ORF type:complete len:530 (-),score=141.71 GGOE01041679.1:220-1758(-)
MPQNKSSMVARRKITTTECSVSLIALVVMTVGLGCMPSALPTHVGDLLAVHSQSHPWCWNHIRLQTAVLSTPTSAPSAALATPWPPTFGPRPLSPVAPAQPPARQGSRLAAMVVLLGVACTLLQAAWATLWPQAPAIAILQYGKFKRSKEEVEEEEFVDDEDETYMGYYPPSPDDTDEDNDAELRVPPVREEVTLEEYRLREYLPPNSTPLEAVGDNEFRTLMASWPSPAAVGFSAGPGHSQVSADVIQRNVRRIQGRLMEACQRSSVQVLPLIVANSSGHGPSAIQAAYDAGQRMFSEDRPSELLRKCQLLPKDIAWHFNGAMDFNDTRRLLLGCPNLMVVETVDSPPLAEMLNQLVVSLHRPPLKVYLPVNFLKHTPYRVPPAKMMWMLRKEEREREVAKAKLSWHQEYLRSGIAIGQELPLVQHIVNTCPGLQFAGLMTSGVGGMCTRAEFQNMVFSRRRIAQTLGLDEAALQLCMGTGLDLEVAIASGATSVRVGNEIFGHRPVVAEA